MAKQFKKSDRIDTGYKFVNAEELAINLARELHGIENNSHGVLMDGLLAISGLRTLANSYLRTLPHDGYNGATVIERTYDDTRSLYTPDYKTVAAPIARDLSMWACAARG